VGNGKPLKKGEFLFFHIGNLRNFGKEKFLNLLERGISDFLKWGIPDFPSYDQRNVPF
jgi:hypothetical protein